MPHGNLLSPTLLLAPPATPPWSNIERAPADYAGLNCLPLAGFDPSRQSAPECFPCQVHAFVPQGGFVLLRNPCEFNSLISALWNEHEKCLWRNRQPSNERRQCVWTSIRGCRWTNPAPVLRQKSPLSIG